MEEQKESIEIKEEASAEEKKSFLDKAKDFVGLGGDYNPEAGNTAEEAEKPKEELENQEPVSTMEAPKPEAVIDHIDELMDALSQLGVVNHMGHVNVLKTMKANLKYQYKI